MIPDGCRAVVDGDFCAIRAHQDGVVCQSHDKAFAYDPFNRVVDGLPSVFIHNSEYVCQPASHDLGSGHAQQVGGDRINKGDDGGRIGGDDTIADAFECHTPTLFAFMKRPLSAFLFRDIAGDFEAPMTLPSSSVKGTVIDTSKRRPSFLHLIVS